MGTMNYKSDRRMQVLSHIVMIFLTICALLPFVLLFMSSITEENTAIRYGFSFIPKEFSLDAYRYLIREWNQIGRAYLMSLIVMVIGTSMGLICSTLLAYGLTRDILGKAALNFYVVFTMLFNGGVVSTYYVYTNIFHVKNTIWGLILPGLMMSAFNIILMKNFFNSNIPDALTESARIDGAGEFRTLMSVVLPLSKPIMATIGLMSAIAYWNDWTNGLYYIDDSKLYTLQLVLNSINENAAFLSSNSSQLTGMMTGAASIPATTMRMAIAVVGILPIMILYPFFQQYFVKGITVGAVKG